MLKMFKAIIQKRLEKLVIKYIRKHQPKLVVVTGSVGKTTTKMAIATVLGEHWRVRAHPGNYNTHLSAPLGILGIDAPDEIHSISQWLNIWRAARLRINGPSDVDVIVQELGSDQIGDIARFGTYLHPDIAVVTAVSAEHMEFFKTLQAVAREELAVAKFSELTIVNRDDISEEYAAFAETTHIDTYGLHEPAEYRLALDSGDPLDGRIGTLFTPEWGEQPVTLQLIGDQGAKAAAAAAAVGAKLGLTSEQISVGIGKLTAVPGRMQILRGLKESVLIDDSYNSSPLAVRAALDVLYAVDTSQRIAILGSMAEMGDTSAQLHEQVGGWCDPQKLAWVITIGDDARKYLAPAAAKQGCQVRSFDNPYDAGSFAHSVLESHAAVLVKGSQNHIFTEEALKILLHETTEESSLVRQSPQWLAIKAKQFERPVVED